MSSCSSSEISRRDWLLKLGEAAFVFGFSGSAAELWAQVGAARSLAEPDLRVLPPGLYQPSSEHMAQVLTRDEPYVTIPPGTETDYVRLRKGPFRPLFFNEREFRSIQRFVKLALGSPPKGAALSGDAELAQRISPSGSISWRQRPPRFVKLPTRSLRKIAPWRWRITAGKPSKDSKPTPLSESSEMV